MLADEPGHAERETQAWLDSGVAGASAVMSVLLHGTCLANAGDVRHELGAQDVDQLLRDGLEGSPRRVVKGFEIGSWRRLARGHGLLLTSLNPSISQPDHKSNTCLCLSDRGVPPVDPGARHSTW